MKILFSISHSFQKRMFFDSGIIEKLIEDGNTVIVVSTIPMKDVEFSHTEERLIIIKSPFEPYGISAHYLGFRRLVLWKYKIEGSLLNFKNNLQKHKKKFYKLAMIWRLLPWEIRGMLDKFLMKNTKVLQFIKELSPDVMVFASGFMFQDILFNYAAYELGIPRIMIGQSWDNFSTKTYTIPKPELLLCWGPRMAEEAVRYNDFPPDRVYVTGPPHFDVYFDIKKKYTPEEAKKLLGLDPLKKLIVFGTSSEIGCPYEYEIVEYLSKLVKTTPNELLQEKTQMVVRLHPVQVVNREKSADYIENLANEYVRIEKPDIVSFDKNYWELSSNDIKRLGLLLRAADIAVNCFSTFSLDAIAFGVPVIIVSYDGGHNLPYALSVRRYIDFIHIKGLLKMGGIKLATNNDELVNYINMYLKNPQIDAKNRMLTLKYELYKIDGKASDRIVDIINFLDEAQSE